MRIPILLLLIAMESVCSSGKITDTNERINSPAKINEIPLPAGYERVNVSSASFEAFLRNIQLKQNKTVYLYNGQQKYNQQAQYAVLNISMLY